MKNKKLVILLMISLAVLLSSCSTRGRIPSSWPGITVGNQNLYVAFENQVYVFEGEDEETRQRFPEDSGRTTFFAAPYFISESEIIVGGYDNTLYYYDPNTGGSYWEFTNTNRWIAGVLVVDGKVFAPNADGTLYIIDLESGEVIDSFDTELPLWATPVTDGNLVFVAGMDGFLYAINLDNLSIAWSVDLDGTMVNPPTVSEDGVLYIGTFESQLFALDAGSGNTMWVENTDGWIWATPALAEGTLYATDLDGSIYAFAASDGELLWSRDGEGSSTGTPLVHDGSVYYATDAGNIYAYDLNGDMRWDETVLERQLNGPLMFYNDLILIGISEGDEVLLGFDINGNQDWEFAPEN